MSLADHVTVTKHFQRSVRIDTDVDIPNTLDGFICHQSNRDVLENMSKLIVSGQRAFTWTGPYGGGKSSLALFLAKLISENVEEREQSLDKIGELNSIKEAFSIGEDPWLFVPVVGRRSDPIIDIRKSLDKAVSAERRRAKTRGRQIDVTGRDVIERFRDEARSRPNGGVLLVIDEMGKFLEYVCNNEGDIHFFQELAESAGRCNGKLIVLGILHQAFEQYANRLNRDIRDEWAKIQGRYIDLPIITAVDETIDLVGHAIQCDISHPESSPVSILVANAITKYRPGNAKHLATRLDRCWPIHPLAAALLGPMSRSRFSQNKRSVFGFLGSAEPLGFQEYLRGERKKNVAGYSPAQLWDYLQANLAPTIMPSLDGHQWAQGVEAIERCEARGTQAHTRITKTIAIINLLQRNSGIMASYDILKTCLDTEKETVRILKDLEKWSIAIFRKHLDAWTLYEGSDFDINHALEVARTRIGGFDVAYINNTVQMPPIIAKRHYHKTGALRWFERGLVSSNDCCNAVLNFEPEEGSAGKFFLLMPNENSTEKEIYNLCQNASELAKECSVAVGFPQKFQQLYDIGSEFMALKEVSTTSHELEGDAVARKELRTRLAQIKMSFEEALNNSFIHATWYVRGTDRTNVAGCSKPLFDLASELMDETFKNTPIVQSELINRIKPSANGRAAVRKLLYQMAQIPAEENLAIEGFKAERGLYSTVLVPSGLHVKGAEDTYGFRSPNIGTPTSKSFIPVWNATKQYLQAKNDLVVLSDLYKLWMSQPYGIRQGVLPVLAMSFILAKKNSIAVYAEGMFQYEINDYVVDILLQDPDRIKLRHVSIGKEGKIYIETLAKAIPKQANSVPPSTDALSVARELVRFVFILPPWTKRTMSLSTPALKVRNILLQATDPHQVLFVDLPMVFDGMSKTRIAHEIGKVLRKLRDAYSNMLGDLRESMLTSLGHKDGDYKSLHDRAKTVYGLTGDLQLDAFSMRLREFSNDDIHMESIASLSIHKPPRDWSDRDTEQSTLSLADFSLKFCHAEVLASVKNRNPTRHAIGVVFGTGNQGYTAMKTFDVSDAEEQEIETLVEKVSKDLNGAVNKTHLALATIARVGMNILNNDADSPEHPSKKKENVVMP